MLNPQVHRVRLPFALTVRRRARVATAQMPADLLEYQRIAADYDTFGGVRSQFAALEPPSDLVCDWVRFDGASRVVEQLIGSISLGSEWAHRLTA